MDPTEAQTAPDPQLVAFVEAELFQKRPNMRMRWETISQEVERKVASVADLTQTELEIVAAKLRDGFWAPWPADLSDPHDEDNPEEEEHRRSIWESYGWQRYSDALDRGWSEAEAIRAANRPCPRDKDDWAEELRISG